MSFIPLDSNGVPSASGRQGEASSTEEVIPAKRVALTDILPLTLVGDQVSNVNKTVENNKTKYLMLRRYDE